MSALKDKEILVIDDAPEIGILAKRILEGDGARVTFADNVEEGIEIIQKSSPHLILTDLAMPGKTGFDLLEWRRTAPGISEKPVIVLSGKKDRESVARSIALGASDYLLKPFRATLMLQKVRKALRLTSFISRRFEPGHTFPCQFSVNVGIVKISEVGCVVEAPIKMGPEQNLKIETELFKALGIQNLEMRIGRPSSQYLGPGRYSNDVKFVGVSEEISKNVRAFMKTIK